MDLLSVVEKFCIEGKVVSIAPMGSGHINTTFLVQTDKVKYTLQRINSSIFKNVEALIDNIDKTTSHIVKKRQSVALVKAKTGNKFVLEDGSYYRLYNYFDGYCIDRVSNAENMQSAGEAFGQFQMDLQDFKGELADTIPNFHNTRKRYQNFQNSLLKASKEGSERVFIAKTTIEDYLSREIYCDKVSNLLASGALPLRVTHNDTKINNIVFDEMTNKPTCIIDLDTVMYGSLLYDFGDAIRSGGVSTKEDEKDTSIINLNLDFFAAFAKGFLEKTKTFITQQEVDLLAFSAILMTYECGMRFLNDYIDNDIYFRISYPDQNLARGKAQMALVIDMEKKLNKMKEIIKNLWNN